MLRLVTVTAADADVLFELVTLNDIPDKPDLLAGFMKLHHFFRSSKDKFVKMTFKPDVFKSMLKVLDAPFMPADADRLGIPQEHYLNMMERIPVLRANFHNPDFILDPSFLNMKAPDRTFLN